jgi:hypothetical protein
MFNSFIALPKRDRRQLAKSVIPSVIVEDRWSAEPRQRLTNHGSTKDLSDELIEKTQLQQALAYIAQDACQLVILCYAMIKRGGGRSPTGSRVTSDVVVSLNTAWSLCSQ